MPKLKDPSARMLRAMSLLIAGVLRVGIASAAAAESVAELPVSSPAASAARPTSLRPIAELKVAAQIHLGRTADWVAVTPDAVWVGGTGPYAVHRIDPATNAQIAVVPLAGEPCAGLAVGFGSLWVPLCGRPGGLAQVDLKTSRVLRTLPIGPAGPEGGVATSTDSVWLIVDPKGSLVRIDPVSGKIRQWIRVPAGSYNPLYADGRIWITRADGAELNVVDATTGTLLSTAPTGPGPRFLTAGAGSVWTLNQGDGSLTRIETGTARPLESIALHTPGHGGDIGFGFGAIWTTMQRMPLSLVGVGPSARVCQWNGSGGDSLGLGLGSLWLTDYHAGNVLRIDIAEILAHCDPQTETERP
jgi:streptogramin lyase